MLNTGLRTGEMFVVLNSDIDLDKKTMKIKQAVKTVEKRDGTKALSKKDIKVGKTKSATSKRIISLNKTAIEMIIKLREERYFGENTPLICDENGGYTKPYTFRNRYYTILKNAGIETKGMYALRHTFATTSVGNGMDIKTLSTILGHISSKTTIDIYLHSTDEMKKNAADKINARFSMGKATDENVQAEDEQTPQETKFEPKKDKMRKQGTGCISKINDHLYEGRYSPKDAFGKRMARNIYAHTREECEEKLAILIREMKAEIATQKAEFGMAQ